jgi:mevalonate kinase
MSPSAASNFYADDSEISLSVPGKTFLLGEYLALFGGPSLIAATGPAFQLKVKKQKQSLLERNEQPAELALPFSAASPAGRFISSRPDLFAACSIRFSDPHDGQGGLGASSAQFALAYMYAHPEFATALVIANAERQSQTPDINWLSLLDIYRQFAWSGEGTPPSGADVIGQLAGEISWFDGRTRQLQRYSWSFPDLDFTLLRTGMKLATHEHLKSSPSHLNSASQDLLRAAVEGAKTALELNDEALFCSSVLHFAAELKAAGLVAEKTAKMIRELERAGFTRAVKGCGAMGADIVLLLHDRADRARVARWARENPIGETFVVSGTSDDLAPGLHLRKST